ncbi:response regulator [Paenibacillus donghaensis]|uniref:DNA-binding response regulator n=1 Tax=Paenibacillus donghaensis TaxID=414771 RepID=A0A2Z2K3Z2_9BACL|nr:response regulator [Paenibacillus donghaensis]ASA20316.1 hypothetical protein B9T62_05580 [Paenibacillus donghaensis]
MFQVLIVDDEESVVEGVAATLPCPRLGIEAIHKAFSASEALATLAKHPVDLLITDIRMPGMSGLELMTRVQEISRTTKCILLTGYADFDYAKQAISGGALNYLLKPVDDEELITAVEQALEAKRQEWQGVVSRERTERTLQENLPLLRRNLLLELTQRKRLPPEVLEGRMQTLGLPFAHGDFIASLMVRLEEPFIQYDDYNLLLMEYAVTNIAEEVLQEHYTVWSCRDAHGYLVFALKPLHKQWTPEAAGDPAAASALQRPQATEILERLAGVIQNFIQATMKGNISVFGGAWGEFPAHLADMYEEGMLAFRRHIGGGFLLIQPQEDALARPIQAMYHLYEPPVLTDLLEAGRWDDFRSKIGRILAELAERFVGSGQHALEAYWAIAGALAYIAHKSGYGLFDLVTGDRNLLAFDSFHSIGQMQARILELVDLVQAELEGETRHAHHVMIRRIHSYIEQHLHNDVSLQAIAQEVFLHPVYVSQLYKNVMGESLSDYVLRQRMEKAAFQIKHSRKKVYEVAELVGYQHVPYFIRVFKKYYGMPPQEYRDAHS